MTEKAFYITTPLFYVNDVPHVGHAYAAVGADVLARFKRSQGREVYLLTGTDEHGQKVAKAAAEKGYASPKAFADEIVTHFEKAWQVLGITHDRSIRTTDADHRATAQEFFKRVKAAGFIEKRAYEGWYCVPDETFWLEKDLKQPGNLCPTCEREATRMKEENYFFLQTKLAGRLREFLKASPDFVLPEARRNEVLGSYLDAEGGVMDLSITRSSVKWGIPVPGDEAQVLYVWFDALIGYLTATGWPQPGYEARWPADVHIIGKEILRFHAVLWPAMLMAAGIEPPKRVFGTGWIVNDGKKMSKSLGNVIDPVDWAERFGTEVLRYYLMREVPFGSDASISEAGIEEKYAKELANDWGNLLSRSVAMIEKSLGAQFPAVPGEAFKADPLRAEIASLKDEYSTAMEGLRFHEALEAVFKRVRKANQYIDEQAPWKLAKDPARRAELENCLYTLADFLRCVSLCLAPFMPGAADRALVKLGYAPGSQLGPRGEAKQSRLPDALAFGLLPAGQRAAKGEGLFPRRDLATAAAG